MIRLIHIIKLKSTGEIVQDSGIPANGPYRKVVRPFNQITRKGHRAELMNVHKSNLEYVSIAQPIGG